MLFNPHQLTTFIRIMRLVWYMEYLNSIYSNAVRAMLYSFSKQLVAAPGLLTPVKPHGGARVLVLNDLSDYGM